MIRHFRFLTVVAVVHLLCVSSIAQLQPSLTERASNGDATAMHLIGRAAAADGNPVEAYAWFSLASEHGVETAEKSALFNELNSAQIAQATQRIKEIKSTLLKGLPEPSPKPAAPVVEVKRPVEAKPVAPPPVAMPVKALPAPDGQVEAQKAQIAKLEADLAAARSEVSDVKSRSGEATSRLEAALAKASKERDALSAQLATLRQDKLHAEDSLAQMRAKPAPDAQVETQKAQIAKLEADLAAAQSEVSAAKARTDEATGRLEAALAKAGQERDALSGEVAALKADKQRAEESLAKFKAQPSLEGEVQSQKAQIAKLETSLASLRQDRQSAEEARDQLRAELAAARSKQAADLAAAQSEVSAAKAKSAEATSRLEAALAKAGQEHDALAGEIAALKKDKQHAEESLAQMRAKPSLDGEVKAQKAQIAKLETDLAAAQSEAKAAKTKSDEKTSGLEAALANAGQEKEKLSAEISTLRRDKLRAEESLAQLQAKPSLDAQVETQKVQIAKLEADLASAKAEASAATERVGATTQLEAALAKSDQEKEALSAQIATLRQDRLRAEEARDQIRADLSAARLKLESNLAAAQAEARVAKQKAGEATRLEEALAKATQERDALSAEAAALREDKQHAEESLARMRAQPAVDEQVKALNARIAELEADLAAARSEARSGKAQFGESTTQLESALAKATEERDALSEELATLRGGNSSEIERLRGELTAAEQARTAAVRDLAAEQIRNENLVRELARARPGMLLAPVGTNTPRVAPTLPQAATSVETPAPTLPRVHTVAAGENLSAISQRYYGTPNRWEEIFNANRDVLNSPNQLAPGMRLRIP